MKFQIAKRKQSSIKMALQGPSGSGKTYSSLHIAYGLTGDWKKIVVIDTQHSASSCYAHLGEYWVATLEPPFEPEKFIDAILYCERKGFQAIILDSYSDEWEFLLDFHASLGGNSYAAWGKVIPRHNQLVEIILNSPAHIILNVRSKQDVIIVDKQQERVAEKVGLKGIQKDGYEYDLPLAFTLDMTHLASVNKDVSGRFESNQLHQLGVNTGKLLLNWIQSAEPLTSRDIELRVNESKSIAELLQLYYGYPKLTGMLKEQFERRKKMLQQPNTSSPNHQFSQNGKHTS